MDVSTADVPSYLQARANNVLNSNPKIANNNITVHGSNWLWAVMALLGLFLLGVLVLTLTTGPRRRVFHYFSIAILLVATIYYFAMASDLGGHAVLVQFRQRLLPTRTRQVFWVRWVGYFINFSLIFFASLLLSGAGWATIIFTVGLTMLWSVMLLVGGLVFSSYKWGFYVFALLIYFIILWQVLGVARRYASRVEPDVHRIYTALVAYILFMMILYFICWGLSEGGNVIQNDSEAIFYGVLDIFTQGLFSVILIFATRDIDFDRMGLGSAECGRVHDHDHWSRSEKAAHRGGNASNLHSSMGHDGDATLSAPGETVEGGGAGHGTDIV